MSDLERQYRAGMRFYTARWRQKNGDALLSTLIDGAEAEKRSEPTATELRDLARTGLRQRSLAVLPFALFAIALASIALVVWLSTGTFGSTNALGGSLPVLPVRAYTGYHFPAPLQPPAAPRWIYLTAVVLGLASVVLGLLALRRNRRLLSA